MRVSWVLAITHALSTNGYVVYYFVERNKKKEILLRGERERESCGHRGNRKREREITKEKERERKREGKRGREEETEKEKNLVKL